MSLSQTQIKPELRFSDWIDAQSQSVKNILNSNNKLKDLIKSRHHCINDPIDNIFMLLNKADVGLFDKELVAAFGESYYEYYEDEVGLKLIDSVRTTKRKLIHAPNLDKHKAKRRKLNQENQEINDSVVINKAVFTSEGIDTCNKNERSIYSFEEIEILLEQTYKELEELLEGNVQVVLIFLAVVMVWSRCRWIIFLGMYFQDFTRCINKTLQDLLSKSKIILIFQDINVLVAPTSNDDLVDERALLCINNFKDKRLNQYFRLFYNRWSYDDPNKWAGLELNKQVGIKKFLEFGNFLVCQQFGIEKLLDKWICIRATITDEQGFSLLDVPRKDRKNGTEKRNRRRVRKSLTKMSNCRYDTYDPNFLLTIENRLIKELKMSRSHVAEIIEDAKRNSTCIYHKYFTCHYGDTCKWHHDY